MQALTIDSRAVEFQDGATVLDAARALGIHIPTMCHVPGLEPIASCFVCAVQVEGRRNLSPACALPAEDGMVVHTGTEDVRRARKIALELLLSDHAGECMAPCSAQCPAGLDIPGFVYQIANRDNRRSMEIIADKLPLPGALGRICPRLCEQECRRCERDQGLAIGALHRFAADQDQQSEAPHLPPKAPPTGKRVAIVGAGPAGLAAGYYLCQKGHRCTLYDAMPQPGGMLRYGIPEYRLPKSELEAEISAVRKLGATFEMNQRWGRDFKLRQLRDEHDAVFLAIGAQVGQTLRCQGEELAISGVKFLAEIANGNFPDLGDTTVIIGGGNTAMDCARSAMRLGPSAVKVLYRRTRREMPCLMEEVEGAEAEGVTIGFLAAPVRLERSGKRLSLTCQHMELGEPDSSGRRRPVPVPASEFVVDCSTVIAATGQKVDLALAEREGLAVTGWGIDVDERTLATNVPGIFAGGDAVLGADLAVRAVAGGRMAATSIDQFLSGKPVTGEPELVGIGMKPIDDAERAEIFRGIEQSQRVPLPEIALEERLHSFAEVEGGLSGEQALAEARRCLTCGCRKADGCTVRQLATQYGADPYRFQGARRRFQQDTTHPEIVYEPGKCIMCDACVRIAAEAGEDLGVAIVGRGFDVSVAVPFGEPLSAGLRTAARHAAEACPSGALSLKTQPRACDLIKFG